MGCKGKSWLLLWIMFTVLFWEIGAARNHTRDLLNSYLYEYALQTIPALRSGRFYHVDPPANLSGIEVSILRLRTHRLWLNGTNFSYIEIPPKTALPQPFTRRVNIIYYNLGNWSSFYYSVPNHTLVAPVVAFLAYDAYTSSRRSNTLIDLNVKSETTQIHVRFPLIQGEDGRSLKCARFHTNGTLQLSNVDGKSTCTTTGSGYFAVVIPEEQKKSKKGVFKKWMVGLITGGILGLGILGFVGYMLSEWIKVRKMERQSETSEGLGRVWIGESRMPIASGIRTQPLLENNLFP